MVFFLYYIKSSLFILNLSKIRLVLLFKLYLFLVKKTRKIGNYTKLKKMSIFFLNFGKNKINKLRRCMICQKKTKTTKTTIIITTTIRTITTIIMNVKTITTITAVN